jgi:PAS domain S-box-containing protein
VVRCYGILDTAPEPVFDDITAWAARLCHVPIAILSLVDVERHWFKSRFGLATPDEAARTVAFCEHAIREPGLMLVPDARADERFADNPFVVGEPRIRFYAGAPLVTADGHVIGTLSVIDDAPRTLGAEQRDALMMLARLAMTQLELRRKVLELEQAEERTRLIVEGALDAVVTIDATGRVIGWSPQAERVFGWSRDEIMGRRLSDTMIPARYCEEYERGLARFNTTGEGELLGRRIEITARHRDGHEFPVELAISPLRTGDRVAFSAFIRDISERVRMEGQLRQAQKMEAVGQLAGGVAHDFNNLLTVIVGRSELLREHISSSVQGKRGLEVIESTARRAAALIQQLLAFSRKQVLQHKVLDLGAVVKGIEPVLRRLISEDIEIVVTRGPGEAWVKADQTQLEQVILNLVVNARDAMPRGGTLTIETRPVELDEQFARLHRGARPGPHVVVSATDTGEGMDRETQGRIFEPFFTTKEAGKGTGLGLATAYGIVKQHDGYIDVESSPGAGSILRVYLPRVDRALAPPEPEPEPVAADDSKGIETILLVEDEDDVRNLAADILRVAGYNVLVAAGAAPALEMSVMHGGPIHLILTDVIMPGMTGRELARRVAEGRPDMVVLYMSGYSDETLGTRGVLEPGITLLQKPFTPATLRRTVRTALDGRRPLESAG